MYLFSRRRRIDPAHTRAALDFALQAAGRAKEITGLDVRPWMAMLSPETGTVVWSARVERLSDLEVATDKLSASTDYIEFIEQSSSYFTGHVEDSVFQVIHGVPSAEPVEYVSVVVADCANGQISTALGLGVEIAETAEKITGMATLFATGVTGPYGSVGWFTGAHSLDALESANNKLAAESSWLQLIDRAGGAFRDTARTTIYRRLL